MTDIQGNRPQIQHVVHQAVSNASSIPLFTYRSRQVQVFLSGANAEYCVTLPAIKGGSPLTPNRNPF